jgi:hypothetical protein
VVDDFAIKDVGKQHANHLLTSYLPAGKIHCHPQKIGQVQNTVVSP